jgi:hypothetical protein
MERLETEAETRVAPHEIRELLTRLNEGSVEALPPSETRTLGGLAVETGISIDRLQNELDTMRGRRVKRPLPWLAPAALLAVTLGIGGWLWTATVPKTVPYEPAVPISVTTTPISDRGLVDLASVTYGPDGGRFKVEPTFMPSESMMPGISISAEVKGVLWGAGDHQAKALREPLTKAQEAKLGASVEELLRHVRKRAGKRGIPIGDPSVYGDAEMLYEGKAHLINLYVLMYNGTAMVQVPVPPLGTDDEDFTRLSKMAAKRVIAQTQYYLRIMNR